MTHDSQCEDCHVPEDHVYVRPRVLYARLLILRLLGWAFLSLLAGRMLYLFFRTQSDVSTLSGLQAWLVGAASLLLCVAWVLHCDTLRMKIFYVYSWAPAGTYFTGSLYLSEKAMKLPGVSRDVARCFSQTNLTDRPYPGNSAIGCNGVIQEGNGDAWFALLVSVNGLINVTRLKRAEYGWQYFIQYQLR